VQSGGKTWLNHALTGSDGHARRQDFDNLVQRKYAHKTLPLDLATGDSKCLQSVQYGGDAAAPTLVTTRDSGDVNAKVTRRAASTMLTVDAKLLCRSRR
jgi:hypothetical protein